VNDSALEEKSGCNHFCNKSANLESAGIFPLSFIFDAALFGQVGTTSPVRRHLC